MLRKIAAWVYELAAYTICSPADDWRGSESFHCVFTILYGAINLTIYCLNTEVIDKSRYLQTVEYIVLLLMRIINVRKLLAFGLWLFDSLHIKF